jgi:thiol-disulfide isomerase/thioredoxin
MELKTAIHWRENLEQARTEAARTGKPVYLDFWAYGCTGCYWMEEATFRDPDVIDYLNQHFVGVQLNTTDDAAETRARLVAWTPTAFVEHHHGGTLRSWVGYLPPREFLAELELSHALHELRSANPAAARDRLHRLTERHADAFAVPEAIYWEGVAAYRERKVKDDLWPIWRELVRRFPSSPWTAKTTLLIEDGPTHKER